MFSLQILTNLATLKNSSYQHFSLFEIDLLLLKRIVIVMIQYNLLFSLSLMYLLQSCYEFLNAPVSFPLSIDHLLHVE